MTHFFNNRCPVCGTVMIHIQRRGSSGGTWMCPVCTVTRHPESEQNDDPPHKNTDFQQGTPHVGRAA